MQQFYANGLAMPSKMDWKEECPFIVPSAARGTVPVDTPQIWVLFLAFCKPFFRKWVHKLKIWGHLFLTRVPLLEKRDPFLKRGVPLLLNRCYSTQIGVPFLSLCDTLLAKRIPFFRRCDYILEKRVPFFAKCVPLLGKRDSILGRSDRTFIISERYLATCVPLSEKRDPILGERDHTFITSEQYFATGDPLLVKCGPYFATCVPMSAKRTTVWQKRDIQISKMVHGESICVPRKRKTIPKKALFCVISSRKSLQASDPITTQAQPKNDLRITQERPKVDPSLTQETAKDDLSLTQPRPSLRTGYRQGSPKDDTTNTQETANNDTRNVRLVYRECTVSVRVVYRKGTKEVLKRYWRATKDPLNACTSCVDQQYSKSRRVVEPMRSKAIPLMAVWLCFMLFNLSDAWAQSAEPRTAEGQTEIKPLKIGDTIPEELWKLPLQVVNHPDGKDTITLNDYRDKKLIILDFWSSWCSSCINSFPSLDSIQNQYANDLQILLLNPASSKDDRTRILYIMEKRGDSDQKRFGVPSIYKDEVIVDYFRPKVYPRLIWINSTGVVLAITGKRDLNSENLQQLLKGEGGYSDGN
ncbi:TlpA family protein disulfide reductase [Sphingobacterium chuzhouense]|uniref:Redoxin domain-containing protein n=1 Tax=Sphingobacterium chuzhouense TaxID=1742264 RepID=A0ABR7XS44_9SPHI|nr:thioredoxin domain-containing protein [Sphingobacterium chuzhouense]MBD1421986.1 redoxin domain-containing protein [Sphingobacterium chuzhouense]